MAEETKNEILNLENNYCIIATSTGQNNLREEKDSNEILQGLRSHNILLDTQRNYDFTNYFEGGKI